jgi:uncharacterized protein (DUF1800 family)
MGRETGSMDDLSVYDGPFGKEQAERLLWRAGFGPRQGDAEALSKLGLAAAVQSLTRPAVPEQLVGPAPVGSGGIPIDPVDVYGDDHLWWLDQMIRTTTPLIERMTLVWHSWFATSNQGVGSQQLMLNQNQLFRANALGSFPALLQGVTSDPAMLVWLNGDQNVKASANQNYGREMMELFTLGADRGAYTQSDVEENARALTGFAGSAAQGASSFVFVPGRHDATSKTIFAHTGNWAWQDSCQLCFSHPLHPSFFVEKLWGYFVPTRMDTPTLEGLKALYAGGEIAPVVEGILMHPAFYEGPRMAKPPVVYNAGLLRMRAEYIDSSIWWSLSQSAGQQLFYPPDVGGWDYTRWLNTATFRARWLMAQIVQGPGMPTDSPSDPGKLVERTIQYWGFPTVTPQTAGLLAAFAHAQLKRQNAAPLVETAMRQILATAPEFQTA